MSQSTESIEPIADITRSVPTPVAKPTARQWLLHLGLFLLTGFTTTICGVLMAGPDLSAVEVNQTGSSGLASSLLMFPVFYLSTIFRLVRFALLNPHFLGQGLRFSASLLAILVAHESGHYLFCRYYGVDATLPFFIPQPPLLIPGTFGAFIRMKSPVPSRRALFDIGLAGPLAGFAVILPVAFAGVLTLHHTPLLAGEASAAAGGLIFNDPLLFRLIARWFRVDLDNSVANSFYLAAWVGALVTSLNLMPVGQLDGGHGTFSVFGPAAHRWIGIVAFVTMALISVLGWLWHGSPGGFVYVVLLAVMLRVRHPQPEQMEPLGLARSIIGILTLIVFVLCFLPFPITIT
ncbi:MAG TPA: site-2 protease family protein [Pyrinomonadaceae bacterium]|nr:site-2 protease family protein [Pyrinomonadaceae bacterium]